MDKEKIKTAVNEVKVIIDELVSEGHIDGDKAKEIMYEFTEQAVRIEYVKWLEVG